ncbi:MAG TPA: FkbM family methyltransferase [Terriglobales bacterium]|nr:FkbM family methyltransferase [Terriglobales bacterium]
MNLRREAINALWTLLPGSSTVSIAGRRYRIPLQRGFDRRLLAADREPWLDPILQQTCGSQGAVLLDAGANCGQTLVRAKAANPRLRYFGFEPNPACAGYVQRLIERNHLPDCAVYACALGASPALGQLFTANPADPSATTIANFRGAATGTKIVSILIERGDDVVARLAIERLDLIKIDVEGAEAAVLAGLAQTIARFRPAIACEVLSSHHVGHPSHELRRRSKEDIGRLLAELGYRLFGIAGRARIAVDALSEAYRNYLFLPAAETMRSTSAVVERPAAKRNDRT